MTGVVFLLLCAKSIESAVLAIVGGEIRERRGQIRHGTVWNGAASRRLSDTCTIHTRHKYMLHAPAQMHSPIAIASTWTSWAWPCPAARQSALVAHTHLLVLLLEDLAALCVSKLPPPLVDFALEIGRERLGGLVVCTRTLYSSCSEGVLSGRSEPCTYTSAAHIQYQ